MTTGQRIVKNLFALFTGEAVSAGLAFLITILLARRLGDEGFGRLAFVQAIMVYFTLITDMGLSTFAAREIARAPDKAGEIMSRVFTLRMLFAVAIIVLFSAALWFYPTGAEMKWLCFGSVLALLTFALNPEFAFQGLERMAGIAVWRIGVHLFYLIMIFYLIRDRGDLATVPFLRLSAEAFTLAFIAVMTRRFLRQHLRRQWDGNIVRNYLKESAVMAASVVAVKLYYTFDTFMLGIMDKPETVGWYNAAYKIVLLFIATAGLMQMAFAPVFSQKWRDPGGLERVTTHFALSLSFLGGLACGTIVILSDEIILLLFGAAYAPAAGALTLLAISMYFVYLDTVFMAPMLYTGRQKTYLILVSIGSVVNVVLNLFLIPAFSFIGAAVATIASNFVIAAASARAHVRFVRQWQAVQTVAVMTILLLGILLLQYAGTFTAWVYAVVFISSFTLFSAILYRSHLLEALNILTTKQKG